MPGPSKISRALISVSDKRGVVELGRALSEAGAELVATGKTAQVLSQAGLKVTPIEEVSGSPEAFRGRMKTLSFPVCSGILYRRGDPGDEADLAKLGHVPIDCVVVNFYPFEQAAARPGISHEELIEEIDIGGPTLVRAAAKNSEHVLVLTSPTQYERVIGELGTGGKVAAETRTWAAALAWESVASYDLAIANRLAVASRLDRDLTSHAGKISLRYGENPHQEGWLSVDEDSPIAWPVNNESRLTSAELSYNNILDLSGAYALASDLVAIDPGGTGVVIVKHNNPCGVALLPRAPGAQARALVLAWDGDPVSAFGGVLVFTHPLEEESARWLSERFVECVAAPDLVKGGAPLTSLLAKRKNLKAVAIRKFGQSPIRSIVPVPGGQLGQTTDVGTAERPRSVTRIVFPVKLEKLARFGIACCRALKSNAIAIVREESQGYQLVGAGQGQPNRVEALEKLAIPRARAVLASSGGKLEECLMISDAFFPFRDTVDTAAQAGIRAIIQPGGSIKDQESIAAADEHGIAMAFTGVRHFRH